ncbi:MAG: baseplate J/gp47 family protein [Oscillospiraceae bacterium]|nr:baseplate J/gp47 family protein [Oscillospiraceae bacterium]
MAENVKKQCFPQTAEGEYLDRHAEMRGLARAEAGKAEGRLTFSSPGTVSAQLTVPEGTVCMTSSGLAFETTESGTVAAGESSCTVAACCTESGDRGNVGAGLVTFMTRAPVGIASCVNEQAFSGGADAESDESLRKRVLSSFRRLPNGANAAYYELEAESVEGVAAAVVTPRAFGIGTVKVTVASTSGVPSEEMLTAVRERLDAAREICVDVTVAPPTVKTVNVTVKVDAEEGYNAAEVRSAVAAAVSSFFTGRLLGQSVTLAKLGSVVYGVPGVRNYRITRPTADVAAERTELPVAGTVSVGAWS